MHDLLQVLAGFLALGFFWLFFQVMDRVQMRSSERKLEKLLARAFDYVTCTDAEMDVHHQEQLDVLTKPKPKSGERAAAHFEISAMRHAAEARRQIFKQWQSRSS